MINRSRPQSRLKTYSLNVSSPSRSTASARTDATVERLCGRDGSGVNRIDSAVSVKATAVFGRIAGNADSRYVSTGTSKSLPTTIDAGNARVTTHRILEIARQRRTSCSVVGLASALLVDV